MSKNVLVIIGSLDRGGCETHLLNVLPRLNASLYHVEVFVLGKPGDLAAQMVEAGVPVHKPLFSLSDRWPRALNAVLLVLTAMQLAAHMLFRRPTIVHFFLPTSYILGAPIAILAGIRNRIMSRRSLNDYQKSKPVFLTALEKNLHQRMTLVLGNSRRVVRQLVEEENAPPARTVLLYNGIETGAPIFERDRTAVRKDLNIGQGSLVIACVANLIPYKGHKDLLVALAGIQAELPRDWRLLVIGRDDGIGDNIRRKAAASGFAHHVLFLGSRSDVPDLLNASDIGVLSSHQEGFSNAVLEGMNAGLPMIVTDVGGNAEAVIENETGIVVPARNPVQLGNAILRLAQDTDLRMRMGQAGRFRVRTHFDIDDCVRRYADIYDTVLLDRPVALLSSDHDFDHENIGGANRAGQ